MSAKKLSIPFASMMVLCLMILNYLMASPAMAIDLQSSVAACDNHGIGYDCYEAGATPNAFGGTCVADTPNLVCNPQLIDCDAGTCAVAASSTWTDGASGISNNPLTKAVGIGTTTPAAKLVVTGGWTDLDGLSVKGTNNLWVDGGNLIVKSGKVGIGTSTSEYKLDISAGAYGIRVKSSQSNLDMPGLTLNNLNFGSTIEKSFNFYQTNGGSSYIQNNDHNAISIDTAGDVGILGTLRTSGTLRASGSTTPTSGKGIELKYDSGAGPQGTSYIQSKGRPGNYDLPLYISGSPILLNPVGEGTILIGTSTGFISKVILNAGSNREGLRVVSSNWSPLVIRNSEDNNDMFRVNQNGSLTIVRSGAVNEPLVTVDTAHTETANVPLMRFRSQGGLNYTILDINAYGDGNLQIGKDSGDNTTTGIRNLLIGNNAGTSITTANQNTAIGHGALSSNISGNSNIALGNSALSSSNGDWNIGVGYQSLSSATGHSNVGIGALSLQNMITGNGNIAIGYNAGRLSDAGASSIYIGYASQGASGDVAAIAIGYKAKTKGSFTTVLGNNEGTGASTLNTYIYGNLDLLTSGTVTTPCYKVNGVVVAGTGCASDISLKTQMNELPDGTLNKLLALRPSTFAFKDEKYGSTSTNNYGLIAQDVERAFPEWVGENGDGYKTVNYGLNIPMSIIKGIQEMYGNFQMLFSWNSDQDQKIKDLENKVSELEAKLSSVQ